MKVIDTVTRTSLTLAVIMLLTITATAQDKLLLSEIVVTPTAGEMVEIYNPGSASVDLTNYYVTDATIQSTFLYYYNIVLQNETSGGASSSDFNARFPSGATIAAGEYQTVALNGSANFFTEFGVAPTYELLDTDGAVPDMLEAETGSIGTDGGLSNNGEFVVLYYWDGATDLVTDIDYVVWGDKNEAVDKTGVSIDGPDTDTDVSAYANDVAIADQDITGPTDNSNLHTDGNSGQRIDFSEGTQTLTGSNGIKGASETSENLSITWYHSLTPTPNEAVTDYIKLTIAEMEVDANGDFVPDRLGQMVEITGVILTPNVMGFLTSHYLDDGTAGTDMFYPFQDTVYHVGDSITVKGVVEQIDNVTEIIPTNGVEDIIIHKSGAEVRVQVVPVSQIKDVNGEEVEGEIVILDEYVWMVDEANWPSGVTSIDIEITNGVDVVLMRLDDDMGLGGDPRACGKFFLTGVVSQFTSKVPPDDNYSVIPRGFEDIVFEDAAVITSAVDQGAELLISWTASPRDVSEAADPTTEYIIFVFDDNDDTEDSVGTVTADNSADYSISVTNPGNDAYIVVIAFTAAGCGLWSEVFNFGFIVGVAEENTVPRNFDISANYPNPFNPTTTIDYQVPVNAHVKIVIFNLLGQQIATLVDEDLTAGFYTTQFRGLTEQENSSLPVYTSTG